MPFGKWRNFEDCVTELTSKGKDEDSAKRICGYLQTRLGKESFSWVGNIEQHEKNLIRGKAIHPIKTFHPEEFPNVRVYLEEELKKAAHTLTDKPLILDHLQLIDGKILGADYENGAVEYVAELNDPQVLGWIKDGRIRHCSVEYDWSSLEKVNGVAPKGIQLVGLALLKDFQPGDPASSVEVWERVIAKLKEAKEAEWDQTFINDLPDSAFAVISKGGTEENGKTTPRNLRHLPHHDARGELNLPHLQNALARLPQTGLSPEERAEAKQHLCGHAQEAGIISSVCDLKLEEGVPQNQVSMLKNQKKTLEEEIKALGKEKADLIKRLGEATIEPRQEDDLKQSVLKELKACVFERVPQHWGYGPYEQNRRIKELIKRLEK